MKAPVKALEFCLFLFVFTCLQATSQTARPGHASPAKPSGAAGKTGTGKPVDPRNFTFKGLRLGMTPVDALEIMERLAQENRSNVWGLSEPCLSDEVQALKEHSSLRRGGEGDVLENGLHECVAQMYLNGYRRPDKFEINLYFAEDLPGAPGTTRLWAIVFHPLNLETDADIREFFAALTERYGPATTSSPEGSVTYCGETMQGKTCTPESLTGNPHLPPRVFPNIARTGLYASRDHLTVYITLWDATLARLSEKEHDRAIAETRTTSKPVF
jgi:hypothetical protein